MRLNIALRSAAAAAVASLVAVLIGLGASSAGGVVAWLAGATAVILGALAGYVALRGQAQAVEDVTAAARVMGDGHLGGLVPPAGGGAGHLTNAFNAMSHRVEDLVHTVEADQARLGATFDASTDAMVAVAPDTTIRLLNNAAVRLFGTDRAHALGRTFIEIVRDYELDALVRRTIAAGSGSETLVLAFGSQRTQLRAAAVTIQGGGNWAVLLMLTDLTEVQRVDQMRRDFVANVSHELRTPLAAIRALVETIEAGAAEPGEETDEFHRRIHQQVDRLTLLVNELLDLSRIELGAVELTPVDVDLAAIVEEAVSLLRPRFERRGLTVEAPSPPGVTVEADRSSVLRVVTNLLDNALKFSPDGATVTVEIADEGALGMLRVADHGPGILPHELPRVFERFYKADASRAGGGTGLGLAIVKHLVRIHGGTVDAESVPGKGAAFTIRLPKRFVGPRPDASRARRAG